MGPVAADLQVCRFFVAADLQVCRFFCGGGPPGLPGFDATKTRQTWRSAATKNRQTWRSAATKTGRPGGPPPQKPADLEVRRHGCILHA